MAKRKILLAEDDEDDQRFFQDFLQHRDDVVLISIVENGVVLTETLESIADPGALPDVIILDQNMPKMNGLQTLTALKEDTRYAHIPVVIYSTYTDEQLIQKGTQQGACVVLQKPITRKGYDEMIETLFRVCT